MGYTKGVEPYSTHMALLARCLQESSGPILELGIGNYSTPLIHLMSVSTHRRILSADFKQSWVDSFSDYRTDWHHIETITDWDTWDGYDREAHWGLVFIDHLPSQRRGFDLAQLANRATMIVAHDTECKSFRYAQADDLFKYRYDFNYFVPWTSVFSNEINVEAWEWL